MAFEEEFGIEIPDRRGGKDPDRQDAIASSSRTQKPPDWFLPDQYECPGSCYPRIGPFSYRISFMNMH